jgi:hypothetical protein
MTTIKINDWDRIDTTNVEAVAKRLRPLGYGDREVVVSLEDRIAVCRMMGSDLVLKAATRWEFTTSDAAPWRVRDVRQWDDFADLMRGDDFRGVLARALDCGGSGYSEGMTVSPAWDATAAEIIEATRANLADNEDGVVDEDDEAILALPPVLLVAIHLRMEGYFIDCIRQEPDLLLEGSIESLQDRTAKRWGKMVGCIIETRKVLEVASA